MDHTDMGPGRCIESVFDVTDPSQRILVPAEPNDGDTCKPPKETIFSGTVDRFRALFQR